MAQADHQGDRAPYEAVVTLISWTATNWRLVRGRLILAGIPHPLRQLPDIHALLDVAEVILTEHADRKGLDAHNQRLYGHTAARPAAVTGSRPARAVSVDPADAPDPPGFSAAEQLEAFRSFRRRAN